MILLGLVLAQVLILSLAFIFADRLRTLGRAVIIAVVVGMSCTTFGILDWYKSLPYYDIAGDFSVYHHFSAGDNLFIWASPDGELAPRTYQIPYDQELREQIEGTPAEPNGSKRIRFKKAGDEGDGEEGEGEEGEGEGEEGDVKGAGRYKRRTIAEPVPLKPIGNTK